MSIQSVFLEKSLEQFDEITKKPEIYLSSNGQLPESVKTQLKEIYDFSKSQEKIFSRSNALPKLLIQNFDLEQIWQEIELQNNNILSKSLNAITKLLVNKSKLVFPNLIDDSLRENEANKNESDNMFDAPLETLEEIAEEDKDDDDDCEEEVDNDEEESMENGDINISMKKKSIIDDDFFKLDEMNHFLNTEDKKDVNQDSSKNQLDSDSDEESIDLFEENEENMEEEADESRIAKFKDFFRSNAPQKKDNPKRNKFFEGLSDNENEQLPKSSFELRQERLQKKIGEIEENAVSEKPWALKGEILAENRPQNSLLEEILEFDLTSRPAPVITENTTLQLEDIIKQRIKDKVFDSVVRKEKPVETPLEYKKKLTLNQEKSKHSLAQIYEKEYLQQQNALNSENIEKEEEEPALHKEVKTMMRDLFNKLDALSNFHFTPKPALPELRVINNLPAITMEEVAPVTSSEAALLAPEEIKNKPLAEILGDSEKTKSDKRRERRKKKIKQKKHTQIINKNMLSNKKKGKPTIPEVLKKRNTNKMEENNSKSIKSSKAFFTQLQEQAHEHINKKLKNQPKKKEKNKFDARKLKL